MFKVAIFLALVAATTAAIPNVKIEKAMNLSIHEENTIVSALQEIYNNNSGNGNRAQKLADYLNQMNFCTPENMWNVIILHNAWFDRHTFHITSSTVKFLAVQTSGFLLNEEIYVAFNECESS